MWDTKPRYKTQSVVIMLLIRVCANWKNREQSCTVNLLIRFPELTPKSPINCYIVLPQSRIFSLLTHQKVARATISNFIGYSTSRYEALNGIFNEHFVQDIYNQVPINIL